MRVAFIEALCELARGDERVFLVTADLGWSVVERFATAFPDRFLNVGVAEAHMAGVATGLAQAGFVPFIYSIASFASMRCYEQVRNGAVLHALPVRVVGIGGGFAYGHAGFTHYALEDLALARCQPAMTVLVPADPAQTRAVVRATADMPGPVYVRVGKGGNPEVPGLGGRFAPGRPEMIVDGRDLLFITCGASAHDVLDAATTLREAGVAAAVAVLAHLPFAPSDDLVALCRQFPAIVSVEEAYTAGGLGSLVAAAVANGPRTRFHAAGVDRPPVAGVNGSATFLRQRHGLDAASLAATARRLLQAA